MWIALYNGGCNGSSEEDDDEDNLIDFAKDDAARDTDRLSLEEKTIKLIVMKFVFFN